jgi:RNA polymerase sigma factor (sigma-70 family)
MAALPPFEWVVREHGPDVWRFCASQVGRERADDCFQETMLAALRAYPSLRDAGAVRAWLVRIAARTAVDLHRSAARTPLPVAEPHTGAAPAREPPDGDLWERVRALPAKQRQAVALRFVLDLDHRGIADVMGTTPEAARRSVFEALRTLRARVGADAPYTAKARSR